jgi:3-hydroxyacyl-CoA dehydrogenase/3a,7a,12a-trihydroxy-5b-cholest-24-enoyl-CoA hydratase
MAKSVFPGDTLVTEMWKETDGRVVFQTKVKERDEVVLSNAAIELHDELPKPAAKAAPAALPAASASAPVPTEPVSADIFHAIDAFLKKSPETVAKVGKVFQFKLSNPASTWTVDVKTGAVSEGVSGSADCTLELSDANFMAMCTGKADPQKLYFGGELKIGGDLMASQRLTFLKKLEPQLVLDAMKARAGGAGSAAAPTASAAAPVEATAEHVFLGIRAYVAEHPELVAKIQTVFAFKLAGPDSAWTVDLKSGVVAKGAPSAADCTLEMSNADFMDMTSGKADPQKLYFGGKLKIGGNLMASQKLNFLQKIDPAWAKAAVERELAKGGFGGASSAPAGSVSPAPAASTTASGAAGSGRAKAIFAALEARLAANPGLADEVKATIAFVVKEPDAAYTVSLLPRAVSVSEGKADADTVLTLADEDLASLAGATPDARDLYQRGKLRVDGVVAVAHRLGFMKGLV